MTVLYLRCERNIFQWEKVILIDTRETYFNKYLQLVGAYYIQNTL